MSENNTNRGLGWKVILPGLILILFALFGLFIVGPLATLTKQDKGQSHAEEVPESSTASPLGDTAPADEEGKRALTAAKAQLAQRHHGSQFESFKVDYCAGDYAVVTFLIEGQGSAAYLVKKDNTWNIVVEGADPSEEELRSHGFPEEIAKYPPPCPVKPRGD